MREAFEKVASAYETVKKSVQEKMKAFGVKFEFMKSELSVDMEKAKSPSDLIALGKKMQEQGEALKMEEESVKQEGMNNDHEEANVENAHHDANIENKQFDENKAAEKVEAERIAAEQATVEAAEAERVAAEEQASHEAYVQKTAAEDALRIEELRAKLNGEEVVAVEGVENITVEKNEPAVVENEKQLNIEELTDKYIFNGEAGTLTIKLSNTPEELRANKAFMKEVMTQSKNSGSVIEYASEALLNDKEFVLFAMSVEATNSGNSLVFEKLSSGLKNDREIVIAAMDANTSLDEIPNQFKDKEVVLRYLGSSHTKLGETIPAELWEDQDVADAALQNGINIQSFPKKYKDDENFMMKAVAFRPFSYVGASERLKNDENFAFAAISGDLEKNRGYSSLPEEFPFELTRNKEFMKKVDDLERKLRSEENERREAAWQKQRQEDLAKKQAI